MAIDKKNIVIIGPAHPLRGGLASFDERLARAFQDEGHRAQIYSFSLQYPNFLFPGTTQFSDEPAPADIKIETAINSINPLNWIKIGNKLKKLQPDLIVVRYWLPFMGPCLGTILRRVKKNGTTKIVCIADNIIPHEKRPGDFAFTKYFIKPVDAFITMSEKVMYDLRSLETLKPAKQVAHPLYDNFGEKINTAEAKKILGIDPNQRIMLFFGFIRKYKGLDLLYEAMPFIKQNPELKDLKLLVAGEFYEDAKPYEEIAEKLDIKDRLILKTSFIPNSEVRYFLSAADLVVQPYRNATQSGVTPLAYHFEVPMVVTNVGGLPQLVPDGKVGLVAEPDPRNLANKIAEYFKLGKDYFLPSLKAEKNKYSWTTLVQNILSF